MSRDDDDDSDERDERDRAEYDDDELEDSEAEFDTEVPVTCPHCGEHVTLIIDPGGGASQKYYEDCEVCCRPWHVSVTLDRAGRATVEIEPA